MNWLNGPCEGDPTGDSSDPREKMDTPPEFVKMMAELPALARVLRSSVTIFTDAGFTDDQAFRLVYYFATKD